MSGAFTCSSDKICKLAKKDVAQTDCKTSRHTTHMMKHTDDTQPMLAHDTVMYCHLMLIAYDVHGNAATAVILSSSS